MTAVTSITRARHAARSQSAARATTTRLSVFALVPVALLIIVGLGALLSASSVLALRETGDSLFYFKRQLIGLGVGIVLFLIIIRIPYRLYARAAVPIFLAGIAALIAVRMFGSVRGGARRWIEIGSVSIQPSEFAKFGLIVFLAMMLSRREQMWERFGEFLIPIGLTLGSVGVLVMLQPDLGTLLLMAAATFSLLAVSAVPWHWVMGAGLISSGLAIGLAALEPYRWRRITAFIDPFADELNSGFQTVQSLVALGTGGMFGVGLGLSRARWSFLPNAHTDFIFSIVGEETGFAGGLAVIGLFTIFTVAGVLIAKRAPDRFGRLLAFGLVAWLSWQALINIGGATAVMPITGIPLPFMSFGGSALIANLAAVGVLINIAVSARSR